MAIKTKKSAADASPSPGFPSIPPGSLVQVKVIKQPSNAAATKTLIRVLGKDAQARIEDQRLRKIRRKGYRPRRRGGRLYGGHLVKLRPIRAQIGESGILTATVDVLRDLGSVQRFVEVKIAK